MILNHNPHNPPPPPSIVNCWPCQIGKGRGLWEAERSEVRFQAFLELELGTGGGGWIRGVDMGL